jgi:hypothetical protein
MIYDYIICGAGPSGLTLAYFLNKYGYKCLLIDKNNSIGGCHRVNRINGLFAEHGPRIYSSAYINFKMILADMGLNFYDLFTEYNFSIANIGGSSLNHLNFSEIMAFVLEFIKLLFSNNSKNISMDTFMINNSFSSDAKIYIDKLCRLTDGAGSDRYSLFEFLQLINQQGLYTIYQPNTPNDTGLFTEWRKNLNNVDIMLNTNVTQINSNHNDILSEETKKDNFTRINSIIVELDGKKQEIFGKNFILAMPPDNIIKLLEQSNNNIKNSFGKSFDELKIWSQQNKYINDIPIIFHWNFPLELPNIYGFPNSDWSVAFIKLSDYMNFNGSTVISTCITDVNVVSTTLNKTANQCTEKELIDETFRQLKYSYPNLPEPSYAFLNTGTKKINNEWVDPDTAFVATFHNEFIDMKNNKFENLYNVGTHNGKYYYNFTSLESAVTSALCLIHELVPESKIRYPVTAPYSITHIIITILLIIVIFYCSNNLTFLFK